MVAAWLISSIDSTKSPIANTQGACRMTSEIPPTISGRLPSKKDDPIHETPKIEITATTPPRMMLFFTVSSGDALNKSMISPAAASITIMMAWPVSTWPISVIPSENTW